jgi:large subunit ribosomal protein L18
MITIIDKNQSRQKRHFRMRKRITGSAQRPRMSVYRSLKHFQVQLIDDIAGVTLLGLSTQAADLKGKAKSMSSVAGAKFIGALVAKKAQEKGIQQVVFDRGGYIYHGTIKALADAAREAGLKF